MSHRAPAAGESGSPMPPLGSHGQAPPPPPRNRAAGKFTPEATQICPMIFGGGLSQASLRPSRAPLREVNMVSVAPQWRLRWSEVPITFERRDYPQHVPGPGRFPLVVSPIVGRARLMKVVMDGGSGLNVLYADTIECMGISRSCLCPGRALSSRSS